MFDPTDFGIVLSQAGGTPSNFYLDIKEVAQRVETLSATFAPMSLPGVTNTSEPYIARTERQEFEVRANFDQVSVYRIRVMTRRDAGPWIPIQTVRSDNAGMAAEHDLSAPQGTLLLQTPAGALREQVRVEVQATYAAAPTSNDRIEVRARCF